MLGLKLIFLDSRSLLWEINNKMNDNEMWIFLNFSYACTFVLQDVDKDDPMKRCLEYALQVRTKHSVYKNYFYQI
jgi:hypothetical protein